MMELDSQHFYVTSSYWELDRRICALFEFSYSFYYLIRIYSFFVFENHSSFSSLHFVYFFSLSISHSSKTIDAVFRLEDISSIEKSDSLKFNPIIPPFTSYFSPYTLLSQSSIIYSKLCKILSLFNLIKLNFFLWSSAIQWSLFS